VNQEVNIPIVPNMFALSRVQPNQRKKYVNDFEQPFNSPKPIAQRRKDAAIAALTLAQRLALITGGETQ